MAKQALSFESVFRDVKNKIYHPIYFLFGEEAYYSDQIANLIEEHAIPDEEKEWNQHILYGKEIDIGVLISYVKRFPMMGEKQLIIVKEAQEVKYFNSKDKDEENETVDKKKSAKTIDPFLHYLENPSASTILVIVFKHKKFDQRLKVATTLKKHSIYLESSKIYDNKIPAWITQYLAQNAYRIHPRATALIAESLGNDLSKIANELDKLQINIPAEREISVSDVQEYIGISKDYNIFEFQAALGQKDVLKCNRIVNYFGANPKNNPMPLIIGQLFTYFSKIMIMHSSGERSNEKLAGILKVNPYFVSDYVSAGRNYPMGKLVEIISMIRKFDLRSKGVDSTESESGELLRELTYHILH